MPVTYDMPSLLRYIRFVKAFRRKLNAVFSVKTSSNFLLNKWAMSSNFSRCESFSRRMNLNLKQGSKEILNYCYPSTKSLKVGKEYIHTYTHKHTHTYTHKSIFNICKVFFNLCMYQRDFANFTEVLNG